MAIKLKGLSHSIDIEAVNTCLDHRFCEHFIELDRHTAHDNIVFLHGLNGTGTVRDIKPYKTESVIAYFPYYFSGGGFVDIADGDLSKITVFDQILNSFPTNPPGGSKTEYFHFFPLL